MLKGFLNTIGYGLEVSWKASKKYTVLRILIKILHSLTPIVGIYVVKEILNALGQGSIGRTDHFIFLIVIYLCVQIITQWMTKLNDYLAQMQENKINYYLTKQVVEKSSTIDLSYFDSPGYYDKLQLMKNNIFYINHIVWSTIGLISSLITFITAFSIMLQFSTFYSIAIVVAYIPIAVFDQLYARKLYNWQITHINDERKMGYITGLLTQKLHAKNIRIFGIAEYLVDIYVSIWTAWFNNRKKIVKKWTLVSLMLSCLPQIFTVFILVEIGINILKGYNNIGDFSLYEGMIGQLIVNVFQITYMIVSLTESRMRCEDFKEFDRWKNEVENTGTVELKQFNSVAFHDVTFTYPGNEYPTIKNLSFEFKRNERLALVGINGAGKTTLVKLILRFYNVSDGNILINGIDVKHYTPESIRSFFSVMFQDYTNYAFSLRENIRISDIARVHTDDDIIEACKLGGADEILKDWDEGLDTYLYKEFVENGRVLSGGENQKVALSRAFYRKADFIILDEPSASLDPESEHLLFEKMIELSEDKGLLLITHRLSNIVLANRIIVIEDGSLIEDGTHAELMNNAGRYAELFRLQAENYVTQANLKD